MRSEQDEKLRALAIDAGRAAIDQWNNLPLEERRKTSLTDFQTDIVVRLCIEVATAVQAKEQAKRAALVAALRGMVSIYDGLLLGKPFILEPWIPDDHALVHQSVMDRVSAGRDALKGDQP